MRRRSIDRVMKEIDTTLKRLEKFLDQNKGQFRQNAKPLAQARKRSEIEWKAMGKDMDRRLKRLSKLVERQASKRKRR